MTSGLNFELVKKANGGDAEAINRIVKLYAPYINKLSTISICDENGERYIGVDVDLQDRLKAKLIEVILKFKIA